MTLPTGSKLAQAFKCTASAVLPRVDTQNQKSLRGISSHGEIGKALTGSHHVDYDLLPLIARLPGNKIYTEGSFAYDVETEQARFIGVNLDRNYKIHDTEFACTLDFFSTNDDIGYIVELKTGMQVEPAADNKQLLLQALCLLRASALKHVEACIAYLSDSNTFTFDAITFDIFTATTFANRLNKKYHQIKKAHEALAAGVPPEAFAGEHCTYCHSFVYCPAQTSLVKAFNAELEDIDQKIAALSPENAAKAYEKLIPIEKIIERIRQSIENYARHSPLLLSDGYRYGEVTRNEREYHASVVREVLVKEFGAAIADEAMKTSKAQITRVLEKWLIKEDKQKEIFKKIEQRDGLELKQKVKLMRYRGES